MTIKYQILVNDADRRLQRKLMEEYCCYGNINHKFVRSEETEDGFESVRLFPWGAFQGIKLHLQHNSPYGQRTTAIMRKAYQDMFKDLGFYDWLGVGRNPDKGKWFEQTRDEHGNVNSITFTRDCPMFLTVAATGIWRLFGNAAELYKTYHALRAIGLHPVIAYIGALQINSDNSSNFAVNFENRKFRVAHLQTHMCWTYQSFDVRCAARLMYLTHKDFLELESMHDEQRRTNGLKYLGRDNWFLGRKTEPASATTYTHAVDRSLRYMEAQEWQDMVTGKTTSRWEPRMTTGGMLVEFLRQLEEDAKLLHQSGESLQGTREETERYINAAKRGKKK